MTAIILPGWTCPCGCFNGEAVRVIDLCRACAWPKPVDEGIKPSDVAAGRAQCDPMPPPPPMGPNETECRRRWPDWRLNATTRIGQPGWALHATWSAGWPCELRLNAESYYTGAEAIAGYALRAALTAADDESVG